MYGAQSEPCEIANCNVLEKNHPWSQRQDRIQCLWAMQWYIHFILLSLCYNLTKCSEWTWEQSFRDRVFIEHFFSVYLGYFQLEGGTAVNQLNRPLSWWEFYSIKSSQQRCLCIILGLLNRASTIRIHQHSYQLSNRSLHILDQNYLVQHTG